MNVTRTSRPTRRRTPTIPDDLPLPHLCYGHQGRLIRTLHGRFDPKKMETPIQVGEMHCGCWVVLDGNTRVAMILEYDAEATVAVIPRDRLLVFRKGEWDADLLKWSTPNPMSFEFVRRYSAELYRARRNKREFRSEKKYEAEIERLTGILEETAHRCGRGHDGVGQGRAPRSAA